jgi:hypothetical protein
MGQRQQHLSSSDVLRCIEGRGFQEWVVLVPLAYSDVLRCIERWDFVAWGVCLPRKRSSYQLYTVAQVRCQGCWTQQGICLLGTCSTIWPCLAALPLALLATNTSIEGGEGIVL